MKKIIASVLALTLMAPAFAFAQPGGWDLGPHGHGGGPAPHGYGGGGPLRFLPEAAVGVLIGGLTYYMLNGNYYQRQGDNYVVVQPPAAEPAREMRVLDFNGKRYYVQEGHYYQRQINGDYIEVPRPNDL